MTAPLAAWERDALVAALVARHRIVRAARRVEHDDSATDEDHEARQVELSASIAALDEHDDGLDDALDALLGEPTRVPHEHAPECPGPECFACSGEACDLCGAGCWNPSVRDCEHDVIERHTRPGAEL